MNDKLKLSLVVLLVLAFVVSLISISVTKTKNTKLLAELGDAESDISALGNQVKGLASDKEAVERELGTVKTQVDGLVKDIEAVKENTGKLEAEKSALETKVSEKEAELLEIKAEVKEVETATAEFEGYEKDEIGFETALGLLKVDDGDLDKLLDDEIDFDGSDYDVHEELLISDQVLLRTSQTEEEFGASPYLTFEAPGTLVYKYVFDDEIEYADIDEDEPLEISFSGDDYKIVDVKANELTLEEGKKYTVSEGDTVTFEDIEVKVSMIGEDYVYVQVGEFMEKIEEGRTKNVGVVDIKADTVLENEPGDGPDMAVLLIGTDVEKTLEDGDEYIEDDERFVFEMDTAGGKLKSLSLVYDVVADDLDDDYVPLGIGESISFPNDYLTLEFYEVTDTEYVTCEFDFRDYDSNDLAVFNLDSLRAKCDEEVFMIGDDEVEEFSFDGTDVYYEDEDGDDQKVTLGDVEFEFDETVVSPVYNAGTRYFRLGTVRMLMGPTFEYLGNVEDEAEATEVTESGNDVGNEEYDLLTDYGAVVRETEKNGDKDKVVLFIPGEKVEGTIRVY